MIKTCHTAHALSIAASLCSCHSCIVFTVTNKNTDGSDYIGATQTFQVNSGERRCITIEILDDSDLESQEKLLVRLTAQSLSVLYGSCYVHITDNDSECNIISHRYNSSPC